MLTTALTQGLSGIHKLPSNNLLIPLLYFITIAESQAIAESQEVMENKKSYNPQKKEKKAIVPRQTSPPLHSVGQIQEPSFSVFLFNPALSLSSIGILPPQG